MMFDLIYCANAALHQLACNTASCALKCWHLTTDRHISSAALCHAPQTFDLEERKADIEAVVHDNTFMAELQVLPLANLQSRHLADHELYTCVTVLEKAFC